MKTKPDASHADWLWSTLNKAIAERPPGAGIGFLISYLCFAAGLSHDQRNQMKRRLNTWRKQEQRRRLFFERLQKLETMGFYRLGTLFAVGDEIGAPDGEGVVAEGGKWRPISFRMLVDMSEPVRTVIDKLTNDGVPQ